MRKGRVSCAPYPSAYSSSRTPQALTLGATVPETPEGAVARLREPWLSRSQEETGSPNTWAVELSSLTFLVPLDDAEGECEGVEMTSRV